LVLFFLRVSEQAYGLLTPLREVLKPLRHNRVIPNRRKLVSGGYGVAGLDEGLDGGLKAREETGNRKDVHIVREREREGGIERGAAIGELDAEAVIGTGKGKAVAVATEKFEWLLRVHRYLDEVGRGEGGFLDIVVIDKECMPAIEHEEQ
jgi:hypothetical protein